jgi:hypothetical protein
MKSLPIPELGTQVFVITDNTATFLRWFRDAVSLVPLAHAKFYTLYHCCPTIYWEHGGETREEVQEVWKFEEDASVRTEHYFDLVSTLLHEFGVPANHIRTQFATGGDNPIKAVINELQSGHYSGVIVSAYHDDLVNRLRGGGLTDLFRSRPKVAVWALDDDILKVYAPRLIHAS